MTRDPPEISAICRSLDFDTFSRYVQGAPGLGDEFSELEESLKRLGSPGVESDGPPPGETATAPGPTAPVRDVIRTNKIDEILKSEWKSAQVAKELGL